MVCCTDSWPPIQQIKRDAFPGVLGFSRRLFPGYGLLCFLVNMPPPCPPPHRRLFLSSGRDPENLTQKWGWGWGWEEGPAQVPLCPGIWGFSIFTVRQGFEKQEIQKGRQKERQEAGRRLLEPSLGFRPTPTSFSCWSWLETWGAHRYWSLQTEAHEASGG